MSETESPVTIAMSPRLLFKEPLPPLPLPPLPLPPLPLPLPPPPLPWPQSPPWPPRPQPPPPQPPPQLPQKNPGPAFNFVKALQAVNSKLRDLYPESEELFKVILIGSSDSLEEEIRKHGLEELITHLSESEDQLVRQLRENKTHLYLTDEMLKAQEAVNAGIAAAVVFTPKKNIPVSEDQLRVAFDGDAVLFSNESELVFQRDGLEGFLEHEKQNVEIPMKEGPFKGFLEVLIKLQKKLHNKGLYKNCPIRTYLVTSRGAGCGGYRALNTLRTWGLELDEAVLLGGSEKGPTLEKIMPHIFFDDQKRHVDAALEVGTVACLVPSPNQQ